MLLLACFVNNLKLSEGCLYVNRVVFNRTVCVLCCVGDIFLRIAQWRTLK